MSAALLVFHYSFTSFAVVLVLGGGTASTTLAVGIFSHAKIFLNYHNAGVLALLETLIAVLVFMAYVYFDKKSGRTETEIEEQYYPDRNKSATPRIMAALYSIIILLFILGPLLSIILESFLYQPSRSAPQILALRWWYSLGGGNRGDTFIPALFHSLILAFSSSSFACLLAILAAGAIIINKKKNSDSGFMRFFAMAPIISSGIVLGLGWLIAYGRNSSVLSLVILHGVIALPFVFNSVYEGFVSLPSNTLNAAAVLGAGPLRTLFTVALPLSFKRIRSAWGFAAAISFGELNAVMMLGIENWETLPLYIYRAAGAYRYGTACAAGTLLMLCCGACFLLSEYAGKKNKY